MTLSIQILGTSAARPTVDRNVSATVINRDGELLLFDCGEGTQRQLMKYGAGFTMNHIFFTHVHADHILGLPGLLSTFGLQDRRDDLHLYVPRGGGGTIRHLLGLGFLQFMSYKIVLHSVSPIHDDVRKGKGYNIFSFPVIHRDNTSVGYILQEHDRPGAFNVQRATDLRIPQGPAWGRLQRGESVENVEGHLIDPAAVMGPSRPGRRIVLTGDTKATSATVDAARNADVLVHDSTFLHADKAKADRTMHATALECGELAAKAGVGLLLLTHFSSKYANAEDMMVEAKQAHPYTIAAWDGFKMDVPFRGE